MIFSATVNVTLTRKSLKISVFGLGYVGTVTAACLADAGHHVIGVDPDRTKVDLINCGNSPIIENDVGKLIRKAVDADNLKPLRLVVNPGNGGAGIALDGLQPELPFEMIKVHYEPDGTFPNGIPNPLLPENRAATSEAVIENEAAMGIAWDGDFDRCFLFDEHGGFIEGYYIVGLLAESILKCNPGANIVHDPRLTWNTLDIVETVERTLATIPHTDVTSLDEVLLVDGEARRFAGEIVTTRAGAA